MPKPKRAGGRTKGTPNKVTALVRQQIAEVDPIGFLARVMHGEAIECCPITEKNKPTTEPKPIAVVPTLDQRQAAAKELAAKLVPTPKGRPINLELPEDMSTPEGIDAACNTIMRAMGAGTITLDEADAAMSVILKRRQIYESQELAREIAEIKRIVDGKGMG